MKGLRALIAGKLRSIADIVERKNKNDAFVDLMADVDDQRAHHFGRSEDLDELDDSAWKVRMDFDQFLRTIVMNIGSLFISQ